MARVDVAGAGFVNIVASPAARQQVIARIARAGAAYGHRDVGHGEPFLVEFVSANPTGPLHVGHGRQAVLGDAISALFATQGYAVTREFYYNDAGAQIENLAKSVQARGLEMRGETVEFPADGYRGDYIREIAQRYVDEGGDLADLDAIRVFAVAALRASRTATWRRSACASTASTSRARCTRTGGSSRPCRR